ncbi:MAG: DUF4422 domain-containing protein [Lachnospiraceae bacterium]|nr:DUF4422 domain-containing protein [Lachnospiraceae bacterium]
MDIRIYVATQKKIEWDLDTCYVPIYVGAALKTEKNPYGYCADNEGTNISLKNRTFCELTALYWTWKNSNADVAGLAHYRRFLSNKRFSTNAQKALGTKEIYKLMQNYDLILPKKSCLWGTVKAQYSTGQYAKDYELCREVISEKYPAYIKDFDDISNSDAIYICNMFIGKKEIINQYCQWLFDILLELENRVDISKYSVSEKRIFGYLSERLFNVWLRHNQYRICEKYLMNTDTTFMVRVKRFVHLFNYKVLKIDVMKHAARRKKKRKSI